ncbi:MAG: hypothetical protein Q4D81_10760 [Eubacteriales bacterium]|nr:hypothetical protein [Eubacteriales bacterium]
MDNKSGAFINFSNHPSALWEAAQVKAAEAYGTGIIDILFPQVDPAADEEDVSAVAEKKAAEILSLNPAAVMCQGEFGLSYSVIRRLQDAGVPVLHACSERNVHTVGDTKTVRFEFVRFRKYQE